MPIGDAILLVLLAVALALFSFHRVILIAKEFNQWVKNNSGENGKGPRPDDDRYRSPIQDTAGRLYPHNPATQREYIVERYADEEN